LEHSRAFSAFRNLSRFHAGLIVLAVASAVYLGCIISPPSLMDDVDAVQAQIARNMLTSCDWVTARLDGIAYLEKSPLIYWMMAVSYEIFGVHDWSARLPVALSAIALCWLTFRIGAWAFSVRAGMYAGLVLSTCVGLFLFTRIQIPDVTVTATIALAMWAFLRALEPDEPRPKLWSTVMAAAIGIGLLLKGLIAALFPIAAALLYLAFAGLLLKRETWKRLHVVRGTLVALLIAAPWHVLATLRNPPYFDFTMHSGPGEYRGFFWFYFFNEHILRFLNLRYPRDYNTVPRVYFWLFHLLWLFPWSVYFPAAARLSYKPLDRAGRTHLLCLCWAGFLLVFFTFSSTQEYYSMPCYPALALLVGSALAQPKAASNPKHVISGAQLVLALVAALSVVLIGFVWVSTWSLPAPGDISRALEQHPEAYTLSLGHMGDLTMASFAYLRVPLVLAGIAFAIGAASRGRLAGAVVMMVLFIHAARLALVVFDPYLASRPLAEMLNRYPKGTLVLDDQYYTFSSVVFYAERYRGEKILLLNGRVNNLEYGSYAPNAPQGVFINDEEFRERWLSERFHYICIEKPQLDKLKKMVDGKNLFLRIESGGKLCFSNFQLPHRPMDP